MPQVYCTVNTCKFHQKGNLCSASEIVVQSDSEGQYSSTNQADSLQATPCSSIDETCCQTFNNKK